VKSSAPDFKFPGGLLPVFRTFKSKCGAGGADLMFASPLAKRLVKRISNP
jgi:hypothetical protein